MPDVSVGGSTINPKLLPASNFGGIILDLNHVCSEGTVNYLAVNKERMNLHWCRQLSVWRVQKSWSIKPLLLRQWIKHCSCHIWSTRAKHWQGNQAWIFAIFLLLFHSRDCQSPSHRLTGAGRETPLTPDSSHPKAQWGDVLPASFQTHLPCWSTHNLPPTMQPGKKRI